MPAYNAEQTLERPYARSRATSSTTFILVDDARRTTPRSWRAGLGMRTIVHPQTAATAATRRPATREALARGADIVVMLHPDYQYTPKLIAAMAGMIASASYDVVLGSRILGDGGARRAACRSTSTSPTAS